MAIEQAVVIETGGAEGIADEEVPLPVVSRDIQAAMVDRLTWEVRVAEFKLLPSKGLPLAESGHRANRFVRHSRHVIRVRVF